MPRLDPLPDYIDADTAMGLRKGALNRRWGVVNRYTCETCGSWLVTTDVDEGTTPFLTSCIHRDCRGLMRSEGYNVGSKLLTIHEAWYRPASLSEVDAKYHEHLKMGGLIRRPLTDEEQEALAWEPEPR